MIKINTQEHINRLTDIITTIYKDEIHNTNPLIQIDHTTLDTYYPEYAEQILRDYKTTKHQLENLINQLTIQNTQKTVKLTHIKTTPIRQIHSETRGQLVSFEGTVKKTRNVHNQIRNAHYQCNHCGNEIIIPIGYDDKVTPPKQKCAMCDHKRGYTLNTRTTEFVDLQLFTVQESMNNVLRGYQPQELQCYLEGQMINKVKPGDKIRANGLIELRNKNKTNIFTEYCMIENIEFLEREFEEITLSSNEISTILEKSRDPEIYEQMIKLIAPSIDGQRELKEAILFQLFSSDNIPKQDGTTQRGDIHILVIGDPGIGKSQILKYVAELAPRGIYTSGKGSSGAGLTATAVKDVNDTWTLEAGAMVLADEGNVCIDEFDKMREEDRVAIHEALEQQTISINKAGINTTLQSRCSVLAAANPKFGNFNPMKDMSEQLNLSSTLLSRFDLIFLVTDTVDEDKDTMVAESILGEEEMETELDKTFLKKYISYARREVHPVLSGEAKEKLVAFYRQWRKTSNELATPVTARQLMGLLRLSKASARVRLSDTVDISDVERAIHLEEYCLGQAGYSVSDNAKVGVTRMVEEEQKRFHDIFTDRVHYLAEEYDNHIPNRTLLQELKRVSNKGTEFVRKWLLEQDSNEWIVFDSVAEYWSVR